MKKSYWKNQEYADFISRMACVDCGEYHGVDRFGNPRVDASHVKTKGSGGGEFKNLIPQCRRCHIKFETKTRDQKIEYIKLAEQFTEMYFEKVTLTYYMTLDTKKF